MKKNGFFFATRPRALLAGALRERHCQGDRADVHRFRTRKNRSTSSSEKKARKKEKILTAWKYGPKISTRALASSHVSRAAPSAADSPSSRYPAGRVHEPFRGSIARLHRSTLGALPKPPPLLPLPPPLPPLPPAERASSTSVMIAPTTSRGLAYAIVPQPTPPSLDGGGSAGAEGAETEKEDLAPPTHACLHLPSSHSTDSSPPHLEHRCCAARTGGGASPSGGAGEGSPKRGWRRPPRRALPSKGRGGRGSEDEALIAANAMPQRPVLLLITQSTAADGGFLDSREGRTR